MNEISKLVGRTVLLVEDESLVALLIEDVLTEAGCHVVLAMRLCEGLEIAKTATLDLAVLDVNLGDGKDSYPVASELRRRGIPFMFAIGYGAAGLSADFRDEAVIQKPYVPAELMMRAAGLIGTCGRSSSN